MKKNFVENFFLNQSLPIQTLMDAVPTPMAFKGLDGKYKLCNRMFADVVGRSRDEVIEKNEFELFPQYLAQESELQDQQLLLSDEVSFSEPSIISGKEGRSRHFIMLKTALKDAAGKNLGIVGVVIEITARKRMEEAINHLARGVSAHTGKAFFYHLAKLLAETLGAEHVVISRHNLELGCVGQQLAVYSHGCYQKSIACELKEPSCWRIISQGYYCTPQSEGKPYCKGCMLAGITSSGFIGISLYDQDGKVVGAISAVNSKHSIHSEFAADILKIFAIRASSEIRRLAVEEEIVKTRDFHMNMLSSLPAMIWRTDIDGKYDYFNKSWLEFTGLELDEALNTARRELFHPDDLQSFTTKFETALSVQTELQFECRVRRHDGVYRWVITAGRPFYTSDGIFSGYVGSCIDITERKIGENHLHQVQRMEALGKLSGGIAHEFNNILTVIEGHAELLKMKCPHDASLVETMNVILKASGRASHLTSSMMAYTQKQLCKPEVLDLNWLICEMKTLLGNIIRKDLTLEIDLAQQRLQVYVDTGQIEQILMNLATNARDALPSGGTLVVRTGQTDRIDDELDTVMASAPWGYAVLTVSDNGCGMSTEILERMYEPYFSTKDVGQGTGLGLSVAYGIVAQHQGHIICTSEVDNGTTFKIYLPLNGGEGALAQETPQTEGVVVDNTLQLCHAPTVLLVDDDAMLRDVVKEILESGGYAVMSAAGGDEALEIYQQYASRISLVLIDFNMPGKNGSQIVKELETAQCAVPIVLMTDYLSVAVAADFDQGLIVDMLSKPFLPATLLGKVKELIHEKH